MKREELFDTMMVIHTNITNDKFRSLFLKREIKDLDETLKKMKTAVERDVVGELDTSGKPKYSNADKRAAEVQLRLDNNTIYVDNNNKREIKQKEIEDLEIQISSNSYMFRAYESFANFKE